MFDFAWSEIALIGVVALVLIGPKDMPVAIKAVSDMVRKARKMAGEFQSHVDEMTKDTGLAEVRQQINEIRNMDIRGEIAKAVDGDGSIRSAFNDDPFKTITPVTPAAEPAAPVETALPEVEIGEHAAHSIERPAEAAATETAAAAEAPPAFIPPSAAAAPPPAEPAPVAELPPAFIPPSVVRASAAAPDARV